MSVSADGNMFAVGPSWDNDIQGNVKVFEWDEAVRAFKHRGFVAANGYFAHYFGVSVSLSADGTTLVAGIALSRVKYRFIGVTKRLRIT